ncbi:conserved hypothetical protein [Candidatus Sulfopaludibacter sp. SbA3]|nr:conserved hypothetical protein [Candidatus Sulfopaludibacter sp. SbA3]
MSTQPKTLLTPEEYLEIERNAEFRSEYWQGEMYAMAGAGRAHNQLVSNLARVVGNHILSKQCEGYAIDMRVRVGASRLYTYPDYVAFCGEPQFMGQRQDTLLNPALIVEVLSPSTESYDRIRKFELYRSIESLHEYLLISSDRVHVDRFTRQGADQWLLTSAGSLEESIHLASLDFELLLADLYVKVELTEAVQRLRPLDP